MIVALVVGGGVYLHSVLSAASLTQGGIGSWWFPQDQNARGSTTSAATSRRSRCRNAGDGNRESWWAIHNNSDWTQTIVGLGGAWAQSGPFSPVLLAVGSDPVVDEGGAWSDRTHWDLPGSIPPHSYRLLRILWTSRICNCPGGSTIIQDVTLRVRVGLITRTEDLQLQTAWAITGTSTSSPASACP